MHLSKDKLLFEEAYNKNTFINTVMESDKAFAELMQKTDPDTRNFINSIFADLIDQARKSNMSIGDFVRE